MNSGTAIAYKGTLHTSIALGMKYSFALQENVLFGLSAWTEFRDSDGHD